MDAARDDEIAAAFGGKTKLFGQALDCWRGVKPGVG